jgi:hypothetical protein
MRKTNLLAVVLILIVATFVGSMRLWWLHAARMEQRYIVDYCRFAVGMPSFSWWPYRIQAAQHLALSAVPDVFGGRPLYGVLFWPLAATVLVGVVGILIAAATSKTDTEDKLLRGAPIVSHWRWNWPLLFRRSQRGLYIDTK